MTKLDFAIRRYCRQVGRCLPCSRADKKEFLHDFERQLRRYAADHPGCTGKEIRNHFGHPKKIAVAYVADMELPQVLKALNVRRRIAGVILASATVAFTLWFALYLCCRFFPQVNEGVGHTIIITEDDIYLPGEEPTP